MLCIDLLGSGVFGFVQADIRGNIGVTISSHAEWHALTVLFIYIFF